MTLRDKYIEVLLKRLELVRRNLLNYSGSNTHEKNRLLTLLYVKEKDLEENTDSLLEAHNFLKLQFTIEDAEEFLEGEAKIL